MRAASNTPESIVDPNAKSDELQDITYDTASTYKDSGSYAKGTIAVSGVALDGTSFESLEIADGVGEGRSISGQCLCDEGASGPWRRREFCLSGYRFPTERKRHWMRPIRGAVSDGAGGETEYPSGSWKPEHRRTDYVQHEPCGDLRACGQDYGPVCSAKGSRIYQRDFRGGGSFRGGDCASGADRYLRRGRIRLAR